MTELLKKIIAIDEDVEKHFGNQATIIRPGDSDKVKVRLITKNSLKMAKVEYSLEDFMNISSEKVVTDLDTEFKRLEMNNV